MRESTLCFSIATPSHNQLEYLRLAIKSVADQGMRVEHLIGDTGVSGVERLANLPEHVCLTVEKDSGMYDALNKAFARATGDILCWLNCDEQYLPEALKKVAEFFDKNSSVDVAVGDVIVVGQKANPLCYRAAVVPQAWTIPFVPLPLFSCGVFIRRRVWDSGQRLDSTYCAIADSILYYNLLKEKFVWKRLGFFTSVFGLTENNLGATDQTKLEFIRWRRSLGIKRVWLMRFLSRGYIFLKRFLTGKFMRRKVSCKIFLPEKIVRVEIAARPLSGAWQV